MNRGLIVMAAVAIGVGAFAGEVRTTYGANAELVDSGISFSPIVFTPEWHSYGAGGDFNEKSDGRRRFSMGTDRQNALRLIEIKDIQFKEEIAVDERITHLVDHIEIRIHLVEVVLVLPFAQDLVPLDALIRRKIVGL